MNVLIAVFGVFRTLRIKFPNNTVLQGWGKNCMNYSRYQVYKQYTAFG